METGRVMSAASMRRPFIHRRSCDSGVAAMAASVNAGDADRIGAARRLDLHLVADLVPHQRVTKGGLEADAARLGVRLGGPDDPVPLLVLPVLRKANGVAHSHHAALGLLLDQDVVADDRLE